MADLWGKVRWGIPLIFTILAAGMWAHESPYVQYFGRYSQNYLILISLVAFFAACCWWVVWDESRYRRVLTQLLGATGIGFAVLLLASVALVDLFIDAVPFVAWLPLLFALYLLWLGRADPDGRRGRLVEWINSTALMLAAILVTVYLTELVFRTVLVENYVPANEGEFQEMIASKWPRSISRERTPGTFRILGIGDSFGEAGGHQNFLYLLEDLLIEAGVSVEVLNFSRAGFEPLEQLALLRRLGASYQPDLILHGFFVGNDFETPDKIMQVYQGLVLRPAPGLQALRPYHLLIRQWLVKYSVVMRNAFSKKQEAANRAAAGKGEPGLPPKNALSPAIAAGANNRKHHRATDAMQAQPKDTVVAAQKPAAKRKQPQQGETLSQADFLRVEKYRLGFYAPGLPPVERWQKTALLLDAIEAEAQRIGSQYMMVIHPDQLQVEQAVVDSLVAHYGLDLTGYDLALTQQFLMGRCEQRGLDCVDLLPAFKARSDALFLVRDTHYNDSGNRLAAESIFRLMIDAKIVSPPASNGGKH